MKAVLLAGGLGTRMREETEFRPKPMVEVGGRPVLWHIMKILGHYGISEFHRVFANEEDMDWGELKVSFHGSAVQYIARRNAWRRTASTSEANAASAPSAPQ